MPRFCKKKLSITISENDKQFNIYKTEILLYDFDNPKPKLLNFIFKIPSRIYYLYKWCHTFIVKYSNIIYRKISKNKNTSKIFRWFKFDIIKNDFERKWKENIQSRTFYNLRKVLYEFELELLKYKYTNYEEFMLIRKEVDNFHISKKYEFILKKYG